VGEGEWWGRDRVKGMFEVGRREYYGRPRGATRDRLGSWADEVAFSSGRLGVVPPHRSARGASSSSTRNNLSRAKGGSRREKEVTPRRNSIHKNLPPTPNSRIQERKSQEGRDARSSPCERDRKGAGCRGGKKDHFIPSPLLKKSLKKSGARGETDEDDDKGKWAPIASSQRGSKVILGGGTGGRSAEEEGKRDCRVKEMLLGGEKCGGRP